MYAHRGIQVLYDLRIDRHCPMPALERDANVDVQVGSRLFRNVPQRMRIDLWSSLTKKSAFGRECINKYPGYQAQNVSQKIYIEISKDIPRTFPDVPGFNEPQGQRRLMRILRSYAILDSEVGYCQGMNFVCGLILKYLSNEAEAFGTFCVLMKERNYRELFLPHMKRLCLRMEQLESVLAPDMAQVMRQNEVHATYYAPQWFMSCFANEMPTTFSARIIDVLMGNKEDAFMLLIKVASSIFKKMQKAICGMNEFETLYKFIRTEPRKWNQNDLDEVLNSAFAYQWNASELETFRSIEQEHNGREKVATKSSETAASNDLPSPSRYSLFDKDVLMKISK